MSEYLVMEAIDKALTIGNKIKQARIKNNLNQTELAKKIGVSPQTVWQWEHELTAPNRKRAEAVAKALSIGLDYLIAGTNPNVEEIITNQGKIPLIGWECSMKEPTVLNWLACPIDHGDDTFALRVKGESMLNSRAKPSFSEGDIIFVDPTKEPVNNSLVIVDLPNNSESIFRQLLIQEGKQLLKALNCSWPEQIIVMPEGSKIRGVVILKAEII